VRLADGSFATLESFDARDDTWRLTDDGGGAASGEPMGKKEVGEAERRAPERECTFAYSWSPSALSELMTAKEAPEMTDAATAPHGQHRTLITQAPFAEGEVMFIDFPCLVFANEPTAHAASAVRWRAIRELSARAMRDPGFALLSQVLGDMAFDESSVGAGAAHVTDGARALARDEGATVADALAIRRACLRLEANTLQCDARGHWVAEGGAFRALYAYTALLNHSCDPTADIGPGRTEKARLHTRAITDLAAGTELTINYGPPELPSWTVAHRRDYLLAHHSFVCACVRCEREGGRRRS